MKKGSLSSFLEDRNKYDELDFDKHNNNNVVYRDLKLANILLNDFYPTI